MAAPGSEKALRAKLREAIVKHDPYAHVVQVENGTVGAGTPDTYVRTGGMALWFELKYIRCPAKPTTPLRLDHLRKRQTLWMGQEWRAGGAAYVLLQAGAYYLLLHPRQALDVQARRHTLASAREVALWEGRALKAEVGAMLQAAIEGV